MVICLLKLVYHCPQSVVDMHHLQIQDYPLAVEVELDGQDQTELHLGIQGHLELEQWDMELR